MCDWLVTAMHWTSCNLLAVKWYKWAYGGTCVCGGGGGGGLSKYT